MEMERPGREEQQRDRTKTRPDTFQIIYIQKKMLRKGEQQQQ